MVKEQQLGDGQRLGALAFPGPAQARGWLGVGAEPGPDGLLHHLAVVPGRVSVHVQRVHRAAVRVACELEVDRRSRAVGDILGHHAVQVGVPDRRPEHQLGGQWRAFRHDAARYRREPDDDVRERALRPDERRGLRLPAFQFGQHLIRCVAPFRGVPADLPGAPDLLRRVQVDGRVEADAGKLGVQRQEPLDDDELTRLDQHRAGELPGVMVVDGLEDRLAPGEQLQMLLHDLYVIAVGVQRGERQRAAFGPVVLVVVIDADCRAAIGPERLDQAARDRRLPGRAVAGDGEHDRSRRGMLGVLSLLHPEQLVRHVITRLVRPRSDCRPACPKTASPVRGTCRGRRTYAAVPPTVS